MSRIFEDNQEFAKMLDKNDNLGNFRQRFYTKEGIIYMCGNSLGLASKDAKEGILEIIEKWIKHGVNIWHIEDQKYLQYSKHLAKFMAPLVKADFEEVTIMGCTTITIHQMISTFYKPTKDRYKILIDDINFPTNRYAVVSQVKLKGMDPEDTIKIVKAQDSFVREDDIVEAMTEEVAIVFLPLVYYRTAQMLDIYKITKTAKEREIIIGWDLSHAIGVIDIDLKSIDADFAVWCTYKYLNGGPGSSAAMYVNKKHFRKTPGLAGWFGNKVETQFQLRQHFVQSEDASAWQTGTPNILSMASLEVSLKIVQEAGIQNLRKKSVNITAYLMYLIEKKLLHCGFSIGNPREDTKRGGHVCLLHEDASRIYSALEERGVIVDFREPNTIRITPSALYNSYAEVFDLVEILVGIMAQQSASSDNQVFLKDYGC